MFKKRNKAFVSSIDVFLRKFNISNPKSPAQQAEIEKHRRVFKLRDTPHTEKTTQDWDDFR